MILKGASSGDSSSRGGNKLLLCLLLFQLLLLAKVAPVAAQEADVFDHLFDPDSDTNDKDDGEDVMTGAKLEYLFQANTNGTTINGTIDDTNITTTEVPMNDTTTEAPIPSTNGTETTPTMTDTEMELDSDADESSSTTANNNTNMTNTNMTDTMEDEDATTITTYMDEDETTNNTDLIEEDVDEDDNSETESTPPPAAATGCSVSGGGNPWLAEVRNSDVICNGTDTCRGSMIRGCNSVSCGVRDCWGATMVDVNSVLCDGESACYQATIGTAERPATSVTCQGDKFTCYNATIFASTTIQCEDKSGGPETGVEGICAFTTLETPCLQCIGSNHGCNYECTLAGEDCPDCRCGGDNCDGVCPKGEEFCRVEDGEIVDRSESAASSWLALPTYYMTSLVVVGMFLVSSV